MKKILLIGILFLAILSIVLLTKTMNKKILVFLGVALLVSAAAFVLNRINKVKNNSNGGYQQNYLSGNTPISSGGLTVPPDVPAEYRDLYVEKVKWLDQKLIQWKPTKYNPMKFNGHLLFASEEVIDTTGKTADAESIDSKFLDMFDEMDVDTISLFIYPDMFAKYDQRYDDIITRIRLSGKQLYVSYMVGGGSAFIKFSNFKEYKDTEINFTKKFVEKYHPDYYVVVDEITTMERRTGLNVSDEEWGKLVLETADLVKGISPKTKTVATGHSQELGFLKALADIGNLDMIGLNIWGIDQIDEMTQIGKSIKDTIVYVQSKGKGVVFEQTWFLLHDAPEMKKISVLDAVKEPDAKYIKVLAYYANQNNVDIYSPFYIGKFIEYSTDPVKFKTSLDSAQRTPAFQAYKSVIEEFRNNTR